MAGVAALMSAPTACGWLQDLPVSVAAHVWLGYEPLFTARDRGWLDAGQVTIQETRSAVESMSALRAGKVHAAALKLDEVLGARATGLALSVVLVFNVSMGADMLLVRPGITELVQLKGLRIGHEASAVAETMLAEILKVAGLQRQDAAYRIAGHLNLPAAGVLAAFKGLILPTVANNHQMLAGPVPEMLLTARRVAARLSQSGLLAQKDALADFVNGDYLPAGPATR